MRSVSAFPFLRVALVSALALACCGKKAEAPGEAPATPAADVQATTSSPDASTVDPRADETKTQDDDASEPAQADVEGDAAEPDPAPDGEAPIEDELPTFDASSLEAAMVLSPSLPAKPDAMTLAPNGGLLVARPVR